MAKDKKNKKSKNKEEGPILQGSKKESKMNAIAMTLLALFIALFLMAAAFFGTFFVLIKKDFRGIGTRYSSQIEKIPLLNIALPKKIDPLDEKLLTEEEVRKKYTEYVALNKDLLKKIEELKGKIDELNSKIANLEKSKKEIETSKTNVETKLNDVDSKKSEIEDEKAALVEEKKKFDELIASSNKEGFKTYFEKIDANTAKEIYEKIIKENQVEGDVKKFSQMYENMEVDKAAKLFETLGTTDMDLVIRILKNMKKEKYTSIVSEMTSEFASKVTGEMSKNYYKQ